MTKEEKRQLLIEFRKYLCEHTKSTFSFIYWPDAERFIKALPDEGEKSAEGNDYEIDFGGNVKCKLVIEGNKPTLIAAMNGYGDLIDIDKINVSQL